MNTALPAAHSIDYRGFTIYYVAGTYYVGGWPKKKYNNITLAKDFIDKQDEADNFQPTKTRPS